MKLLVVLSLFAQLGICSCDDLYLSTDGFTYRNSALGHGSFIDHLFVSDALRPLSGSLFAEESGANVSDHRPVIAKFALRERMCFNVSMRTAEDNFSI
jgi:endonuclease/exonuclease/phosphatase (EEP) superfamily protein YafD